MEPSRNAIVLTTSPLCYSGSLGVTATVALAYSPSPPSKLLRCRHIRWLRRRSLSSKIVVAGIYEEGEMEDEAWSMVQTKGNQFVVNGQSFYVNGFNTYWLMKFAVDQSTRGKVNEVFQQASSIGLTACCTWAFNDGQGQALQKSPSIYDEEVFKTVLNRVNTLTNITYEDGPTIFAWELMNGPRWMAHKHKDLLGIKSRISSLQIVIMQS